MASVNWDRIVFDAVCVVAVVWVLLIAFFVACVVTDREDFDPADWLKKDGERRG